MSRNAQEYIDCLFKRLLAHTRFSPEKSASLSIDLKTKDAPSDVQSRFREIKFSEITDPNKDEGKDTIIDLIPLATGGIAVKMSYKHTKSLVLIGSQIKSEELKNIPLDIFEYDESPDLALFLILNKEFEQYFHIKSQVSPENIENILDIVSDSYEGHSVEDVSDFYDSVYTLNINSDSVLTNNTTELVIELSRFVPSLLHCKDIEFINLINRLSKSEYIDKPMLYDSLISFYSKHAFLDIYRCLEKLFYFAEVYLLRQEFLKNYSNFTLEIKKLKSILCESKLSWNRTEKVSITKLFQLVLRNEDGSLDENNFNKIYKESIFGDLNGILKGLVDEIAMTNKKAEYLASGVYKYRNSLVHHEDKEYKKVKKLSAQEWQILANSVAYFLLAFIQKFDNTLEEQS